MVGYEGHATGTTDFKAQLTKVLAANPDVPEYRDDRAKYWLNAINDGGVYLSGNWTVNDIIFGWNRVFVIGFALMIVFGVWLGLTRTSLGLLIRCVMQNRMMASCMST